MTAGAQEIFGNSGQAMYAVLVPWKSGEMDMKSLTMLLVDGQYFRAH